MTEAERVIQAPVFNIQNYCIHDGPGIRTTVFVKGCPLRCLWCANPESNSARPQLMTYANKCTACSRCADVCPKLAIAVKSVREKSRAVAAVTDRNLCTDCGRCVTICQADAREIAGRMMTVGEALKRVTEDKIFYQSSGGGMTMSGGEVLLYPDFAAALMAASHEAGINTAVESCCYASRVVIRQVFEHVDYGLLDIKHMDTAVHKQITGVPNEQILDNIRYIYHYLNTRVTIRIPVIPGYNETAGNIAATAAFIVKELGTDVAVHLLPYHNLGSAKNESLGMAYGDNIKVPSQNMMNELKMEAESYGLEVRIGGS